MANQFRPRLTEEEYRVVLAMKNGWRPDPSDIPDIDSNGLRTSPCKILILDIETAPLQSYTWGCWKQNIQPGQIITDWFMLTWSAKWLFEDQVYSDGITPVEVKTQDDNRITRSIWKLLDSADIVIAHNANNFDIKRLQTRFLLNDIAPPMPYQVIDTLEHLRKRFSMSSNRLDYVNELLGLGKKLKTEFSLWDRCMRGESDALKEMEAYNRVDVEILEETYLRIRSWIKPHPNLGLFIEDDVDVCPSCSSSNLSWGGTPYRTSANSYESFRCEDCGSVGRSKKPIKHNSNTRSTPK